jgi:large repetitive protein
LITTGLNDGASTYTETINGLTNDTTYVCTVSATNSVNESKDSNSINATPRTTLAKPTISVSNTDATELTVAYTTTDSNVTSWSIYYKKSTDLNYSSVSDNASPYVLMALTNGATYNIYVTYTNSYGDPSPMSDTANERVEEYTPDAPTNVSVKVTDNTGTSNDIVAISWTVPKDNGLAITQYQISYKETIDSAWTDKILNLSESMDYNTTSTDTTGQTTLTFTNLHVNEDLNNGSTYDVKVYAYNSMGYTV